MVNMWFIYGQLYLMYDIWFCATFHSTFSFMRTRCDPGLHACSRFRVKNSKGANGRCFGEEIGLKGEHKSRSVTQRLGDEYKVAKDLKDRL